jgi:site-specific DNA-methyltransferase (adenine-specific)
MKNNNFNQKIICNNSLNELRQMQDNSIDSVVTDPPYGLSFMGKKWDYDVPTKELWQEVYRVLKPGGYLLSFAGTRTQHRMAVNIEDAGFEIRDMIAWVYGSGFPKSLNIGKAVDKLQGNEREVVGKETRMMQPSNSMGGGVSGQKLGERTIDKGNSPYEGWGTALKPALEPITVARKPISEKNIAQNVLKWGTGGVNIDGCRVGMSKNDAQKDKDWKDKYANGKYKDLGWKNTSTNGLVSEIKQGRFPANLIHDGSDEVVELFPETKGATSRTATKPSNPTSYSAGGQANTPIYQDSTTSAARFFYVAKASKRERNKGLEGFEEKEIRGGGGRVEAGYDLTDESQIGLKEAARKYGAVKTKKANTHPTVKPVKLMQYLVRLVTPKGGTVLDPFNGSGTTGIACKLEGFDYIGIELDPEYVKISEARIKAWNNNGRQDSI